MLVHDLLRRGNGSDDAVYSQLGALTYLGLRVAEENSRRHPQPRGSAAAREWLFSPAIGRSTSLPRCVTIGSTPATWCA